MILPGTIYMTSQSSEVSDFLGAVELLPAFREQQISAANEMLAAVDRPEKMPKPYRQYLAQTRSSWLCFRPNQNMVARQQFLVFLQALPRL
jgi:hypothetical protein